MQLDMFEGPLTEVEMLKRELIETKQRCDNTRRGLFQRYNALSSMFVELSQEVFMLKFRMGKMDDEQSYRPKDEFPDLFEKVL